MSTTDLLNGTYPSLPDYNIKNNPNIFNFNSVLNVNRLKELLLAISYNRIFFDVVTDLKNMGRGYYNNNPRKFCSTVQLNPVEGFGGKAITVYLPSPGGVIANSIEYVNIDYIKRTWLMRVLQNQKLPTCWSGRIKDGSICLSDSVSPSLLTDNEKILYYYIKNADFFTRTLQLLTNSFYIHSVQRFQCYVLVFPYDLYPGTLKERTFTVTNDFLKAVYSEYLRNSRIPNSTFKLPAPITISPTYDIPTSSMTETELNKYMNNNTNSFNI